MSETRNNVPQRVADTSQESKTSLFTLSPAGVVQNTPTFSAKGDTQLGQPIRVIVKHTAAADVAFDAAGALVDVFGTKPTLTQGPYRILSFRSIVRTLRTGGTPDHDVKLQKGDGAASEAFSDVATRDVDADTANQPTECVQVPAQLLWSTGQTLRTQLQVSGSTTTGTAEVDVEIVMIPAKA